MSSQLTILYYVTQFLFSTTIINYTIYSFPLLPTCSQQVSRVFIFHFITLKHTPQSVGLLWTRDRPGAETST
jgi:hypothetical protein